jgi:hypothetical protein
LSINLSLTTASDATLDAILATPALVHQLLDPNDKASLAWETRHPTKWWERLLGHRRPPRASELCRIKLALGPDEAIPLDLDKSWAGIRFLLTGTASEGRMPEGFLLCGGTILQGEEVGYEPARLLRSGEVAHVARALASIPPAILAARYDPDRMLALDIYPGTWDRPKDEELGWLIESYEELRGFVNAATDKHLGLMIDVR